MIVILKKFLLETIILIFILLCPGTDYNRNLLQNYTDDTYFCGIT